MRANIGVQVGVGVLLVGALVLIIWASASLGGVTGEICITYNGLTECRVASGNTEEEAIRTAADMACSALASGMTERINCQSSTPTSVTWQ
ncbi:MAG: hypothetical protein GKS06_15570 [Acidobacteria bacterium]|nr:hypothetical protein [Acidobacteriota bacterium]